jgi:hypothetical protein
LFLFFLFFHNAGYSSIRRGSLFILGTLFFIVGPLPVLGLKTQLIWELKRHHIYEYNKKRRKRGKTVAAHASSVQEFYIKRTAG